jgi:hypothetical protein
MGIWPALLAPKADEIAVNETIQEKSMVDSEDVPLLLARYRGLLKSTLHKVMSGGRSPG